MDLEKLGLTKIEAKIYLALLKEGNSLASKIIKKVQMHRATVYDVLDRLIEKGLVSSTKKDGKNYYQVVDPERFLDIFQEKKNDSLSKEREIKSLVGKLKKFKEKSSTSEVEVLTGKNGLKFLMRDLLTIKEFLVLGGEIRFFEYLPIYTKHWIRERERKKVRARILANLVPRKKWSYNKHKLLPKDLRFPSATIVYQGKVAIILPEEPIKIILIRSDNVYRSYKSEFEVLWKGAS